MGLADEVAQAVQGLTPGSRCTLTLTVDSVSPPRADRGNSTLVRVYVESRNVTSSPATTSLTTPAPPSAPAVSGSPATMPLEVPGATNA